MIEFSAELKDTIECSGGYRLKKTKVRLDISIRTIKSRYDLTYI